MNRVAAAPTELSDASLVCDVYVIPATGVLRGFVALLSES